MTDYHAVATQAARKYGIPANVFLRQIQQESGFNPNARSSAGAEGIAQFMPSTARGFGIDPLNPVQALFAAAKYDRQGVDQYGSLARALSAYNSGKPDAYLDPHFAGGQTYNYVRQILGGPQVPGTAPGNTAAAAPAVVPSPTAGAAAPPPGLNLAALLNLGNNAVGLPPLNLPLISALTAANAPNSHAGAADAAPSPAGHNVTPPTHSAPPATPAKNLMHPLRLVRVPNVVTQRPGVTVDSSILQRVESISATYGVKVSSGYRSPMHNAEVGGAPHSDHLNGMAVDLVGSPSATRALYESLTQHPGAWSIYRIAYVEPLNQSKNHVHITFRR